MISDAEGQEALLDRYRKYLAFLVRVQVNQQIQGKIDISGIVQQTLLEAYRALPQFQAKTPGDLAAWLRRILAHNLADEMRKLNTAKRGMGRKRSLEAAIEESSSRVEAWLAADESTPSQKVQNQEQALRVAEALASLPDAQREALELQHWHGWSLAKIAGHMGRSHSAVAGLIKRGLEQLRKTMSDER